MDQAFEFHREPSLIMSSAPAKAQSMSLEQSRHVAMMKLLRILRKDFQELNLHDRYLTGLIAAVALAKRSILPELLKDSSFAGFIQDVGDELGTGVLRID